MKLRWSGAIERDNEKDTISEVTIVKSFLELLQSISRIYALDWGIPRKMKIKHTHIYIDKEWERKKKEEEQEEEEKKEEKEKEKNLKVFRKEN